MKLSLYPLNSSLINTMKILLFWPRNVLTIPLDVPLVKLLQRGHEVVVLTMSSKGALHDYFGNIGIPSYSLDLPDINGPRNLWAAANGLVRFCRQHQVEAVFSHLQQANFAAALAKERLPKKLIFFRHHLKSDHLFSPRMRSQEGLSIPRAERIQDWVIHRRASQIVVPSKSVFEATRLQGGVSEKRLSVIPYQYDFPDMASKVSPERVLSIRENYPADLLAISIMRMVPYKRHHVLIKGFAKAVTNGKNIHLLLLDDGPTQPYLQALSEELGVSDRVHFLGFRTDVLDLLSASDLQILPSLSDASNSAAKESGLVGTPVAAMWGVGDFEDYIIDGENGFLLNAAHAVEEITDLLTKAASGTFDLPKMGERLGKAVKARFQVNDVVIDQYEALLHT